MISGLLVWQFIQQLLQNIDHTSTLHHTWGKSGFWLTYFACHQQSLRQQNCEKQFRPLISVPGQWNFHIWWPFTETGVSWKVLRANKRCLKFFHERKFGQRWEKCVEWKSGFKWSRNIRENSKVNPPFFYYRNLRQWWSQIYELASWIPRP